MVPIISEKLSIDPTEVLEEILENTWRSLCVYYDAGGELPEMRALFDGADVTIPRQAAEIALANMLMDLVENISRFSPWYTKPARAFGIKVVRDAVTKRVRFVLAPEAIMQWGTLIEPMAISIRQNIGFIKALLYVDKILGERTSNDLFITASCACLPPHTIKVEKTALDKKAVFCNFCMQPFI